MAKDIAALNQNIVDYRGFIVAYQTALATAQTQKAQLVQDVLAANQTAADAVAAMSLAQADKAAIQALQTQKAQLVQDVLAANQTAADAVAAMSLAQADKAAIQALLDQAGTDIAAAVDATDAVENEAIAGLPGVPPIDTPTDPGTPPVDPDPTTPTDPPIVGFLALSYADRASFDAAVATYTGVEAVTVDGANVKAATDPAAAPANYFSHSADGSITTSGPQD